MAPPKFGDLNKTSKDLFSDDFGFGAAKLTLKTKAGNANFKFEQARKYSDGTVAGSLETKYALNCLGLNFKTVWNTSNALTSEIAWAPKNVKGLKFTQSDLATTSSISGCKVKTEFSNDNTFSDLTISQKEVNATTVYSHGAHNFGVSATFDRTANAVTANTVAGSYTANDLTVFASVTNGTEVAGSIHHKQSATVQTAFDLKWSTKTAESTYGFVVKYNTDATSFVKASLDKKGTVGFGYTQKLRDQVSLTLAAEVDTANLSADKHRLGASLTFDL